ncbi:hypothetical protein D3C72_783350 [compost metagenome]
MATQTSPLPATVTPWGPRKAQLAVVSAELLAGLPPTLFQVRAVAEVLALSYAVIAPLESCTLIRAPVAPAIEPVVEQTQITSSATLPTVPRWS